MRKLVYYVAVTLDGYLAGPNGEFDFFPVNGAGEMATWINERYPESVPTALRAQNGLPDDTPNRVWDTVLMGRGSYEPALSTGITSPYSHLQQYVVSTTLGEIDDPAVELVESDPVGLVQQLKKAEGKDIWLCGGGKLAGVLLDEIDELIIKTYPVLAGAGLPVIAGDFRPTQFTPTARREFDNGALVTWLART